MRALRLGDLDSVVGCARAARCDPGDGGCLQESCAMEAAACGIRQLEVIQGASP